MKLLLNLKAWIIYMKEWHIWHSMLHWMAKNQVTKLFSSSSNLKLVTYFLRFKKVTLGHNLRYKIKVTFWWNFSQTSSNELECCQKQCKCCCWWFAKSNSGWHLFNNWHVDLTASTHNNAVLCSSVPSAQNSGLPMKLASRVFNFTMYTPSSPEST